MSAYYRKCWTAQRAAAKQRKIPFRLTYEEWFGIWQRSGRLRQRGAARGSYQMSRLGDVAPYCSSNVAIITIHENLRQAAENRKRRLALTAAST